MHLVRRGKALDRCDLVALVHHREAEAGINPDPVDHHGSGTALVVITPLPGARQMQVQVFAQRVEQGRPRIETELALLAIGFETHRNVRRRVCLGQRCGGGTGWHATITAVATLPASSPRRENSISDTLGMAFVFLPAEPRVRDKGLICIKDCCGL